MADDYDLIAAIEAFKAVYPQAMIVALAAVRESMQEVARRWAESFLAAMDQIAQHRAECAEIMESALARTVTPEDTLRNAGIDDARQAEYQRRMSQLLGGNP